MDTADAYDNLNWRSVDELSTAAPGSDEEILYASSDGRWETSLAGTQLLLQLVSISDGLSVGTDTEIDIFDGGLNDTWNLGEGEFLDFNLVLWTEDDAAAGTYSVGMRLLGA